MQQEWQKLDPRSIWLFGFNAVVRYTAAIALIAGVVYLFILQLLIKEIKESSPQLHSYLINMLRDALSLWSVAILALVGFSFIWAWFVYQNWRFKLEENRILIERGVVTKHKVAIPYERVQNIDIIRGIMARILGLSDLQISTAGYSGVVITEGRLPGLSQEIAETLRETILSKISKSHSVSGI